MNRWQVFRRGSFLGVMTAAEIRRALREGVVDPFDLVCREGSQLRVEILEVDEIFTARQEEQEDGFTQISAIPLAANAAPQPQYVHHQSVPVVSHAPRPINVDPHAARRKSLKKFYLIDPNHSVLGPLAAGEIQSLATRGIIGRGVKVQKMGDPRKVSLGSFLRSYAQLNAGVRGVDLRSSRALNGVYRGYAARRRSGSILPYLMVILVGAILGFLVYFAIHPQKGDDGRRVKHRQERRIQKRAQKRTQAPTLRRISAKKERTRARPKTVVARKPVAPPPTERVEKKVEVRREWPGSGAPKKELKKSQRAKKPVRAAPPPKKIAPKQTQPRPAPVARTPIPQRKPVAVVAPRPAPPPPKPRAQPKPVAPPPAPKPAQLVDGEVATISGMSYSISELDECPIKCKLRFSKSGLTVTAIFFKGAHLDALLAKNGNATISGRVKKQGGETQIFLDGVR